ncbi:MAG: hypothetical protein EXX96DRAFT_615412 [Benjaminiella poitrasii]|nr:MAG: hypothetical protein EXX96DRAFT_615412 [Benjaminiella poitrasii]
MTDCLLIDSRLENSIGQIHSYQETITNAKDVPRRLVQYKAKKKKRCKRCADKRAPITGKKPINFSFRDGCKNAMQNTDVRFLHARMLEKVATLFPHELDTPTLLESVNYSIHFKQNLYCLIDPNEIHYSFDESASVFVRFKPSSSSIFCNLKVHAKHLATKWGQLSTIVLTCEVYARSTTLNIHSETSGKSLPRPPEHYYIGIVEESNGFGIKKKTKDIYAKSFHRLTILQHIDRTGNLSLSRLGSRILQQLACGISLTTGMLKKKQLSADLRLCDIIAQDHVEITSWVPLRATAKNLNAVLLDNDSFDVLKFVKDNNLSELAHKVNKSISIANQKIATNVQNHLHKIYQ